MNLKISGINIEVTEALRDYVEKKLERIFRHADGVISTTVTLSVDKLDHKAEADVHLSGKDLHVEHTAADMYAAVDTLMDKLDCMILKTKEKQNAR